MPYTLEFIADELQAVLEEVLVGKRERQQRAKRWMGKAGTTKVHMVGESFGGVVLQHFANRHGLEWLKSATFISSLCRTELNWTVFLKATFVLPVVRLLGSALPGLAQRLFAFFHADDVVEAFEPPWMRDFFVKEASWAHHHSVMARIGQVIALDMCTATEAAAAWTGATMRSSGGGGGVTRKHVEERSGRPVPALVVYGNDDNFTKNGSLELHHRIAKASIAGRLPRGPRGARPTVELLGLPGGHLPHVTRPREFAQTAVRFFRSVSS